jgi:hypothetical protein
MTEHSDAQRFLARIVAFFSAEASDYVCTFELLATRADGDIATVLYRENPHRPVLGERFDLIEWASLFDPDLTPEGLADIAIDEQLLDPTGRGIRLDVDWADGLVDNPREVEWVGFGEPPHEPRVEHPDPPGTTYDASYSAPPT